jgi:hypothetical protein
MIEKVIEKKRLKNRYWSDIGEGKRGKDGKGTYPKAEGRHAETTRGREETVMPQLALGLIGRIKELPGFLLFCCCAHFFFLFLTNVLSSAAEKIER